MIEYLDVLPQYDVLNAIESIYKGTFPPSERRKFEYVRILLEKEDVPFHMICAVENGTLLGFLSYWCFNDFWNIEHFAVDVNHRNKGIGSGLMEHFVAKCGDKPVILEVELPESYDARRRVDFYMRHSFIIWKRLAYVQPPYEKGGTPIEMKLMTLRMNDMQKVAQMGEVVRREIYKSIEEY